jgi:hypothetical protein
MLARLSFAFTSDSGMKMVWHDLILSPVPRVLMLMLRPESDQLHHTSGSQRTVCSSLSQVGDTLWWFGRFLSRCVSCET